MQGNKQRLNPQTSATSSPQSKESVIAAVKMACGRPNRRESEWGEREREEREREREGQATQNREKKARQSVLLGQDAAVATMGTVQRETVKGGRDATAERKRGRARETTSQAKRRRKRRTLLLFARGSLLHLALTCRVCCVHMCFGAVKVEWWKRAEGRENRAEQATEGEEENDVIRTPAHKYHTHTHTHISHTHTCTHTRMHTHTHTQR